MTRTSLLQLLRANGLAVEDLVPGINYFEGPRHIAVICLRPADWKHGNTEALRTSVWSSRPAGINITVAILEPDMWPAARSVHALSGGYMNTVPLMEWLKQHAEVIEC